jgi:hypothetical protein
MIAAHCAVWESNEPVFVTHVRLCAALSRPTEPVVDTLRRWQFVILEIFPQFGLEQFAGCGVR